VNVHRVAHQQPCRAGVDLEAPDAPAEISTARSSGGCPGCMETLDIFVEAYGARRQPRPPYRVDRRLSSAAHRAEDSPALTTGAFMRAFSREGAARRDAREDAGEIILNPRLRCSGSAVFAADL